MQRTDGVDTLSQGPETGRAAPTWRSLSWRGRRRLLGFGVAVVVAASTVFWLLEPAPIPIALPDNPPYDHAPGRFPIPAPQPVDISRQILGATLPWTGDRPTEPAARAAAGLVIGRWCRTPAQAAVSVAQEQEWRQVVVVVAPLSGQPFQFLLRWDGTGVVGAYRLYGGPAPDACG